jgi:hypothetical protein
MGQNSACQKALCPSLPTQSVDWCRRQADPSISDLLWEALATKQTEERRWTLQELSRVPTTSAFGSREDSRADLSDLYELMFPMWGPTSHVT